MGGIGWLMVYLPYCHTLQLQFTSFYFTVTFHFTSLLHFTFFSFTDTLHFTVTLHFTLSHCYTSLLFFLHCQAPLHCTSLSHFTLLHSRTSLYFIVTLHFTSLSHFTLLHLVREVIGQTSLTVFLRVCQISVFSAQFVYR